MLRWITIASLVLVGCSSDAEGTTGKRITLHSHAVAEAKVASTFTTGFGWDVTLTKAAFAVGGLYYFDGPPPTAMRTPTLGERLASVFIGTAWAHPGHYQAGTALGQAIFAQPVTIDLFSAMPITLPDGEGITGTYRSARVVVPSSPPPDAVLGGHIGIVEGHATKHDGSSVTPIYFRVVADYADVSTSIKNGAIDGCAIAETNVTDSGTMTVEAKPSIWLNLVDFSKVAPGSAESPTEVHDSGFSQGLTQLSAYAFTYAK